MTASLHWDGRQKIKGLKEDLRPLGERMQTRGAYHLHRKTGNSGWKIKWYGLFRSERSGKSGRSFEAIHFSRPFRFSRVASVPFDSIHLDLSFLCVVKTKWRPKIKATVGENYMFWLCH